MMTDHASMWQDPYRIRKNMADNTEVLKHEFFFRGFCQQSDFCSRKDLTPDQRLSNPHFDNQRNRRAWLNVADAFGNDSNGDEIGSAAGEPEIDRVTGTARDSVIDQPILKSRFQRSVKNIRLMPSNAAAPILRKASWDSACIVLLAGA
jgi:hypothetical protein